MSDLQAIADRVEIEALRGEFTDAVMMNDHDRLASLFTPGGAMRIPLGGIEAAGPEQRPACTTVPSTGAPLASTTRRTTTNSGGHHDYPDSGNSVHRPGARAAPGAGDRRADRTRFHR
jgi:hypothetical protein